MNGRSLERLFCKGVREGLVSGTDSLVPRPLQDFISGCKARSGLRSGNEVG